jgi:hypothetical protein
MADAIDGLVRYVGSVKNRADVSNTHFDYGLRRLTSYFDCPVRCWFACLLVSLTDFTELTSVLTVSAVALFVCYFNLSDPSKPDNDYTKLYDYMITFQQEIELVWFMSWNHIDFLFLLVRYTPFAVMYPLLNSLSF